MSSLPLGVKKLRYQAIVGIPKNRLMDNGKAVKTITKKGQQIKLTELDDLVTASWFYLQSAVSLLLIEIESKRELLASQGLALELISIQV